MYSIRSNYKSSRNKKKIYYLRRDTGDESNIPNMLSEYYDLWIKHFDNITMPMMLGFYLYAPPFLWYAMDLEHKKLYQGNSDSIDVNNGPKYPNRDIQVDNWWKPKTVNNLYNMFSMNTKYEDMDQEIYPTNVKAYTTDASQNNVALESLLTEDNYRTALGM